MNENQIIMVDDNIAFCESISFLLETVTNTKVIIYNNAVNFLKDYSSEWKGHLLIDLWMPNLDGISLLEELKKLKTQLNIVVISGHADKTIIKKIKKFGVRDFLLKPFDVKKLLSILDN